MRDPRTPTAAPYLWLWLWGAASRSVGAADLTAGLLGAVAAFVVPRISGDASQTVMSDLAWQIPVFTLAAVMFVRLALSPYWIWKREREEVIKLRERLAPRLEFVFDKGCPACYSDYTQAQAVAAAWPSDSAFVFVRRFGIRNISASTIEQVGVFLERLEPATSAVQLPAELRPMNQSRQFRNTGAQPSAPLTLNPSGSSHEHVNFLFSADSPDRLAIDFAREAFFKEIADNFRCEGTIRAEGKDVPPIYADFVYHGDTGDFVLTPRPRESAA